MRAAGASRVAFTIRGGPAGGSDSAGVVGLVQFLLSLALAGVLLAALMLARMPALAGAPLLGPDQQLELAADQLEAATAAGGAGFSFTVETRSQLAARKGGPLIEIPDPSDPQLVIGTTDRYYLGSSIATGIARNDGWFIQMRRGPMDEEKEPDFAHAEATLAGLVTGGEVWRNDGEGWYRTDVAPSIGLDPATLALLPKLLREATGAVEDGVAFDGIAIRSVVKADGAIANAPGLIAVDLGAKSILVAPVEFQIDGLGRMTLLRAELQNSNETTFDLIVETTITFDWSAPGELPKPDPVIDPDKAGG